MILNTVCGINAIGMKRKGIATPNRANVKKAYKLLYRSGLNVTQAIAAGQTEDWTSEGRMFMDFVGHRTKRGLCAAESGEAVDTR